MAHIYTLVYFASALWRYVICQFGLHYAIAGLRMISINMRLFSSQTLIHVAYLLPANLNDDRLKGFINTLRT